MSTERLRFSTAVLRLLGEELNPSPTQGILELIKNSYDADAKECIIELKGVHIKGGSIHVADNGNGMTANEIREGWLVVGDSLKSKLNISPGGRLLVGNKGLGRLGALRLGNNVSLISRPKDEPTRQYRVDIDWSKYNTASVVEDIEIGINEEERDLGKNSGTETIIDNLPVAWEKKAIERLARAILLLIDPFGIDSGFRPILKTQEFQDIVKQAQTGYFAESDFHLIASLDKNGFATAEVKNIAGETIYSGIHKEISDDPLKEYKIPATTFELWEIPLDRRKFITKSVKVGEVANWLRLFGGVRLYHRSVRVLPYGEPNNDWLDMNLRRARSPELRPSTNNSIGCIRIEDPQGILEQKTDRMGIVENEAFEELRRFAGDILDWMAAQRLKERDRRKKGEKERVEREKKEAEDAIKTVIAEVPETIRPEVENAIQKIRTAHELEVRLLSENAQLYYTLGTVGTTAAAFAHQTKHPLGAIVQDAKTLEDWLGDPNKPPLFFDYCTRATKRIQLEANAIYSFAAVTLKLLEHEKRNSRRYPIQDLINEAIELLNPYIDLRKANINRDFIPENPSIWCSKAAFEAIITNLLTNSLQAFVYEDRELATQIVQEDAMKETKQRNIYFRTRLVDNKVILIVADNGPGINDISIEDIWLPGKTTTIKGTGLGLAIVKDVVTDLGGSVEAESRSEFGGAKFTMVLPIRE